MKRSELTQKILKDYLDYNPETGLFTAKHSARGNFLKAGRELGSLSFGYKIIKINGVMFLCHRLAWLYTHGYMPETPLMLDHIDRVKDNNAIANLRVVNRSENGKNAGLRAHNTSGFKGVYLHKPNSKWQARIDIDGVCKSLGYYKTKLEAILARQKAEVDYGFYEISDKVA